MSNITKIKNQGKPSDMNSYIREWKQFIHKGQRDYVPDDRQFFRTTMSIMVDSF